MQELVRNGEVIRLPPSLPHPTTGIIVYNPELELAHLIQMKPFLPTTSTEYRELLQLIDFIQTYLIRQELDVIRIHTCVTQRLFMHFTTTNRVHCDNNQDAGRARMCKLLEVVYRKAEREGGISIRVEFGTEMCNDIIPEAVTKFLAYLFVTPKVNVLSFTVCTEKLSSQRINLMLAGIAGGWSLNDSGMYRKNEMKRMHRRYVQMPTIHTLNLCLHRNSIHGRDARNLFSLIAEGRVSNLLTSSQVICTSFIQAISSQQCVLQRLTISIQSTQDAEIFPPLAYYIKHRKLLTHLDLSVRPMDLATVERVFSPLDPLVRYTVKVVKDNWYNHNSGPPPCILWKEALGRNILQLHLVGNKIDTAGANLLFEGIQEHPTLISVNLAGNPFIVDSAPPPALIDMCSTPSLSPSKLQYLDLSIKDELYSNVSGMVLPGPIIPGFKHWYKVVRWGMNNPSQCHLSIGIQSPILSMEKSLHIRSRLGTNTWPQIIYFWVALACFPLTLGYSTFDRRFISPDPLKWDATTAARVLYSTVHKYEKNLDSPLDFSSNEIEEPTYALRMLPSETACICSRSSFSQITRNAAIRKYAFDKSARSLSTDFDNVFFCLQNEENNNNNNKRFHFF